MNLTELRDGSGTVGGTVMSEVDKAPPHKNRRRRRRDAAAKRMGRRDIARRGRFRAIKEGMEELSWQT